MAFWWFARSASPRSAGSRWCSDLCPRRRQGHNDVAGFIYAVVGVIYAVLLALMVIAVWEDYEKARDTV
jgi:hypothetical protein